MKQKFLIATAIVVGLFVSSCSDPKTGKEVKVPGAPTYAQLETALEYNQGFLTHPDAQVRANAMTNITMIFKKKEEIGGGKNGQVASRSDGSKTQQA